MIWIGGSNSVGLLGRDGTAWKAPDGSKTVTIRNLTVSGLTLNEKPNKLTRRNTIKDVLAKLDLMVQRHSKYHILVALWVQPNQYYENSESDLTKFVTMYIRAIRYIIRKRMCSASRMIMFSPLFRGVCYWLQSEKYKELVRFTRNMKIDSYETNSWFAAPGSLREVKCQFSDWRGRKSHYTPQVKSKLQEHILQAILAK